MRIARAPLRITLGGGGSDLAPGGVCITAAITLYAYVIANRHHAGGYIVKHDQRTEHVERVDQIAHEQIRYCLQLAGPEPGLELASMCDVPGGTGLGASGAFSVATFAALDCPDPIGLGVAADIGWQDQRACLGGVRITDEDASSLINCDLSGLRLYDTGMRHDAFTVLHTTDRPPQDVLVAQAKTARDGIMAGDFSFLTEQWRAKFAAAPTTEHRAIHHLICGLGVPAKLVGAGNGGMILAWAPDGIRTHLREIPFAVDYEGVVCRSL